MMVEHSAIALAARLQMLAQREPGRLDIPPLDRLIDAPVFGLDLLKIEPPLLRGFRMRTQRLARNDHRSEKMHESFEIGVARGRRDRAVKSKIGLDRGAACRDRRIENIETAPHLRKIFVAPLLGGDARRLQLHSEPKLQHVEDLGQRTHLIGYDAKRRVCLMIGDEYARALAA